MTARTDEKCGYCGGELFLSVDDVWLHDASTDCGGSLCPDCGEPTYYTDARGWKHQDPDSACFLAR